MRTFTKLHTRLQFPSYRHHTLLGRMGPSQSRALTKHLP
ncbi:MAG: hypothetical protein LZF86_160081 [Nitrospira sp.]|nr:MAG: hypothetical protein LZF86_160081 [Nitrospira sp.]